MSGRRGLTLLELIVAMGVALLVAGLAHMLLLRGRRLATAQAERVALQDNVRTAALVLAGELGALGHDEITAEASAALGYPAGVRSDLLALAPGAVTYLAARGHGFVCGVSSAPAEVRLAAESWWSPRNPRATDSLLVFAEGDPTLSRDDAWLHLGVLSAGAGTCPDGRQGVVLRVAVPTPFDPAAALARVSAGAPVRLAEVMQVRYYASGGESWFGMRSVSTGEAITPAAGPLADSTGGVRGLTLAWLDAFGLPTSNPAAVRAVDVSLLGVTARPIHGRDAYRAAVDSLRLAMRVALRDAPGP